MQEQEVSDITLRERSVSVVLLAGGQGKRMGVCSLPKLFSFPSLFPHRIWLIILFLITG